MPISKKFKFLIFYSLFIFLFIFSTEIVLSIPLKQMYRIKRTNLEQYNEYSKDFIAVVESFSETQDLLFTVEFSGYAFIKTEEMSNDKVIKLIFSSAENDYEVHTGILDRFNLRDLFKQNEIIGINHGFISRFSPIKMKNGIYRLYIYCVENDNTIGFIDTGREFEKTYRSFKDYKQ